jgi:hypothetical protein
MSIPPKLEVTDTYRGNASCRKVVLPLKSLYQLVEVASGSRLPTLYPLAFVVLRKTVLRNTHKVNFFQFRN